MMVIKKKQIIVALAALLLFVAGVLQIVLGGAGQKVSQNENNPTLVDKTEDKFNSSSLIYNDAVSDSEGNKTEEQDKEVSSEQQGLTNYFAYEKTERKALRQERQEALNKISTSDTADQQSKAEAYTSMMELTALTEREQTIENMIISCGFDDCIVYFFEDGTIDVYVAATKLSGTQATQIADIVARNTSTTLDKVYVKTKF